MEQTRAYGTVARPRTWGVAWALLLLLALAAAANAQLIRTVLPPPEDGENTSDQTKQPQAPAAGQPAAAPAAVAPAEAAPAGPVQKPYLRWRWLAVMVVIVAIWFAVLELVSEDQRRVRGKQYLWNEMMLAIGLVPVALAFVTSPAFILLLPAALAVELPIYVVRRNRRVEDAQRIFTGEHLAYVLHRILQKLGFRKGVAAQIGKKDHETEIVLLRKDGKDLEAISGDTRAPGDRSEAVLGVKEVIESAVLSRATDIHIESKENEVQVRFRIDGILHNVPSYAVQLGPPMISALKVLADEDEIKATVVAAAIKKYGIDPNKPNPVTV